MAQIDKSFEKNLRKLKPPTSATFDPALWLAALADCPFPRIAEQRLVDVASWIGNQSALGQASFGPMRVASLDSKWQTLLAIASLNREYRVSNEHVRENLKSRDKRQGAIIDDLRSMTVPSSYGTRIGFAEVAEHSVDSIESWLFDALMATGIHPDKDEDLTAAAVQATRAYTWKKSLNVLWNQALHLGAYLSSEAGILKFLPKDEGLERLLVACLARQELKLLNFPTIDLQNWIRMTSAQRRQRWQRRTVTEVKLVGERLKLKVGTLSYLSKHLPAYLYDKGGLEGSYLADFLEEPMPVDNRINPLLLLDCWHVIRDAAEAMTKMRKLPEKLTPLFIRELALVVERSDLVDAIAEALGIDSTLADALTNFLTYTTKTGGVKGHRGLWSAPLVQVPGTNSFALPLPALVTSNPLRRLEAWLEKGGIDDSNPALARGDRYEALYRVQLGTSIQSNPKFKTAYCAEHSIKKGKHFHEQIDLVFAFGGLAVVGELKFFLTPADPHERRRYFVKLEEAAAQASRKALALNIRRDVIAKALKISQSEAENFEILPIVVTNQGFAISHEIQGVRIVDADFLKTYLSGGDLVTSTAYSTRSPISVNATQSYYSSEIGARRQFEEEIACPFVLRRFLDRVKSRFLSMPAFGTNDLLVAAPYLAEIDGFERTRADTLMGVIGR